LPNASFAGEALTSDVNLCVKVRDHYVQSEIRMLVGNPHDPAL